MTFGLPLKRLTVIVYFENSGIDFTAFKQTKHDVETRNRKKSRNHR